MLGRLMDKAKTLMGMDDPQSQLNEKASEWMTSRWTDLKTAYLIFHMSVWESLLFYAGQSWIAWDENRKIWYPNTPTDEWVPRPKINRFSPTIDSITSNFNTVPDVEAVPKSDLAGDERIHGIAQIASALGRHFVVDNGLQHNNQSKEDRAGKAAQIFVLAGNLFTIVMPVVENEVPVDVTETVDVFQYQCDVCDLVDEVEEEVQSCPHCGAPVQSIPKERTQPSIDPTTGQPLKNTEERYKIKCDIGNPLYALPRPGSTGMDDLEYMMWAERKTLDWCYWNLDGFEAEADYEFLDSYSITFEHALNYYYTGYSNTTLQSKDSCLVKFVFIEPGKIKDFPDGLYAVMVNGKIAKVYNWNDIFVEHPLTRAGYLDIPTLFFSRSVAFDLVEIQREKQGYESLIKLHAMTSSVDSIVVDENTVVSEITGRADKIIKWRSIGPGSQAPHRMQHGTLDDGVYKMRQALHDEFENISGAVAVFRGRQPGSITAAKGIEDLKGQAEQMFSKPTLNWNDLWRETVRKGVRNMQHYYTPAQIAEIVGPDLSTPIMDFKNCDLDNMLDWVATSMGQPRTRNERKAEFQELFDRGALDMSDPNVKQQLFELYGHTGMLKMFNADATRARWENKQMMNMQKVVVKPEFEDLQVHYAIHVETIKNLEFEKWPPDAKQMIMEHTLETEQLLQAKMAANPPTPPPGQKGGGPPPPKKPGQKAPPVTAPAGPKEGTPE